MKILIVEDDLTCRRFLSKLLAPYGDCDTVPDGENAVETVKKSIASNQPYNLICLDITLPNMTGIQVLSDIRQMEKNAGVLGNDQTKIIMTTACNDPAVIMKTFKFQCEGYLVKPITRERIEEQLKLIGLL